MFRNYRLLRQVWLENHKILQKFPIVFAVVLRKYHGAYGTYRGMPFGNEKYIKIRLARWKSRQTGSFFHDFRFKCEPRSFIRNCPRITTSALLSTANIHSLRFPIQRRMKAKTEETHNRKRQKMRYQYYFIQIKMTDWIIIK